MNTTNKKLILPYSLYHKLSKKITDKIETISFTEWVEKHKNLCEFHEIIYILFVNKFISEKDLRLFSVWCARESLKLIEKPDKKLINVCDVSEHFANGEATKNDLDAARNDALKAAVRASKKANKKGVTDSSLDVAHCAAMSVFYTTKSHGGNAAISSSNEAAWCAAISSCDATTFADIDDKAKKTAIEKQLDKLLTYLNGSVCSMVSNTDYILNYH